MVKRQSTVESKKRYDYEEELEKLHLELMKLQEWVKAKGLRVLVLFEGRAWSELLSRPQGNRVVLRDGRPIERRLPDYRELDDLVSQYPSVSRTLLYAQRHFPAAGEPMLAFFGFLERSFREFDFTLGMYEARRALRDRKSTRLNSSH